MDIQYSSLHPDDKTQLLVKASKSLTLLREDDVKRCFAHTTDIKVFGDIDCLSVHCLVGHQADKSRKFTASSDLRTGIRDTCVIDLGFVNQYATRSSDPVGVQVCASYDRHPCDCLCLYCDEIGATKVFVSDQAAGDVVNQAIGKAFCSNVSGHENQIHMDFR